MHDRIIHRLFTCIYAHLYLTKTHHLQGTNISTHDHTLQ